MHDRPSALVVFSGGQDSTTALLWAQRNFRHVTTISFDYGQRHSVELDCARMIAKERAVKHVVLPISGLSGSALTDNGKPINLTGGHGGLPSTFVPGRNAVFFALAAAQAATAGIYDLVTGICQTDYSGYPDCREAFRIEQELALSLALDHDLRIHAPLMFLSKAETVQMVASFDRIPLLALTHTCYKGERPACGTCPACELRLAGFREADIEDPLEYQS